MNKRIFILIMSIMSFSAIAQQTEQYSLHNYNPYLYNPAYAGFDGSLSINANLRSQWNEIEGNPTSQHINAHLPMYAWSGGLGIALENESLGAWKQTKISISGNYVRELGRALISFGANVGWVQNRLDGLRLVTVDGIYEGIINHNDPILPVNRVNDSNYFLDVGLVFSINQLQISVSAKNINEPAFGLNESKVTNIRFERSYYGGVRYNWRINEDIQIQPMFLIKSNVNQTQVDATVSGVYRQNFMLGTGYRGFNANTSDAILMLFGIRVSEKLWLRYAYDFGLSDIAVAGNGSHELGLNYNLNKILGQEIKQRVIYNPRFLE